MPQGLGSGTPLIQHDHHGNAAASGVALVAECGQHFLRRRGDLAIDIAIDFLGLFGLVERDATARSASPEQFELLQICMVRTDDFKNCPTFGGIRTFPARRTDCHRRQNRATRALRPLHHPHAHPAAHLGAGGGLPGSTAVVSPGKPNQGCASGSKMIRWRSCRHPARLVWSRCDTSRP
jgi:hypothetical protein